MTELGMDPERVLAIAARLDATSARVRSVGGTVDRVVAGAPASWKGPSVEHFLSDWRTHRACLTSASDVLRELAQKARTNAHEQLRTSSEYGSVVGAGKVVGSSAGSDASVGPDQVGAAPPATPPPVGTPPALVSTWWASLTPAQQQYLLAHDANTLGQLKGLPAPVLDTANRQRLIEHDVQLRAQLAALGPGPDNPIDALHRAVLEQQLADDQGILTELGAPGPGEPPVHTYLLAYDPTSPLGQTGVEISYGNPDTAANTAVIVPGTTHRASGLSDVGTNGRDLYTTIDSPSKAVVVWLDGPEPQSLFPDAAQDDWANASSPRLVNDLAGLRDAHYAATGESGHTTAIGHSYGSYILGKALSEGARPDDVVFVGSPGVGVDHASDLGVDPSHVWDGQVGNDPILNVERRFTPDPFSGYNPSESGFGDEHFSVDGAHGHSSYFDSGSESLSNIAKISSGNYDAVDRVDAPNYHGKNEILNDYLGYQANPFITAGHETQDLLTGHPIDAATDGVNGFVAEGRDLANFGIDGTVASASGARAAGGWLADHVF